MLVQSRSCKQLLRFRPLRALLFCFHDRLFFVLSLCRWHRSWYQPYRGGQRSLAWRKAGRHYAARYCPAQHRCRAGVPAPAAFGALSGGAGRAGRGLAAALAAARCNSRCACRHWPLGAGSGSGCARATGGQRQKLAFAYRCGSHRSHPALGRKRRCGQGFAVGCLRLVFGACESGLGSGASHGPVARSVRGADSAGIIRRRCARIDAGGRAAGGSARRAAAGRAQGGVS